MAESTVPQDILNALNDLQSKFVVNQGTAATVSEKQTVLATAQADVSAALALQVSSAQAVHDALATLQAVIAADYADPTLPG